MKETKYSMIVTDKRDMFDNSMCLINGEGGKKFQKLINGEVPIRAVFSETFVNKTFHYECIYKTSNLHAAFFSKLKFEVSRIIFPTEVVFKAICK